MESDSQTLVDTSATERQFIQFTLLFNLLQNFQRAPKKDFIDSWKATNQSTEGKATARIFLDAGFAAWLAYFLARNAANAQYHLPGKAAYIRLIANLEEESTVHREKLAAQVTSAVPPDVAEKIDRLYANRIKPLQNENMSQHQNKRPRTADGNDYSTISSTNSPYPIATSPSGSTQPSTSNEAPVYPSVNSTNYFTEDQHILVNASLLEATKLFPRDLSDAIKRNPSPRNGDTLVAAISMTFPNTPSTKTQSTTVFECQMAIEITDDKVSHFARELFGVRLETRAGLRYMCSAAGGSKVLPNPKFTLQGCRRDIIPSAFGPEPATAIITNTMYQEDVRQCRDCTDSVSMVVSHRADDGAVIYVSLG